MTELPFFSGAEVVRRYPPDFEERSVNYALAFAALETGRADF
jgi:hypothetical protein